MFPLAYIIKTALLTLFTAVVLYIIALLALTIPWLQRQSVYAHKINTAFWSDIDRPEQWGFAKNQVTPFTITTLDNEHIYAWHILPVGLYAQHELELLEEPSGHAEDITKTKAFNLLRDDPDARLVVSLHGNAGHVAQGWRPNAYRSIASAHPLKVHTLAIDYRGFGHSTGFPTEQGLITDAITALEWAMNVAQIPSERILLLGHSLGTAVTSAAAAHFSLQNISFAGVVLLEGFPSMTELLTSYSIAGWVPLLAPLRMHPSLLSYFKYCLCDTWDSAFRLTTLLRESERVRLYILHARNDFEIPWYHSDSLFKAAMRGARDAGSNAESMDEMKEERDFEGFVRSWSSSNGEKLVRQEVVGFGAHNEILSHSTFSLLLCKAFRFDEARGNRAAESGF